MARTMPAAAPALPGVAALVASAVAGLLHESLIDAGLIGHPYFGDNETSVRRVEDATWWYRAEFGAAVPAPGERVRLIRDGLDTVASVWLNGALADTHESQFRPGVFGRHRAWRRHAAEPSSPSATLTCGGPTA